MRKKRQLNTNNKPGLSVLEKEICNSDLTLPECTSALKNLANNKSPGSDSFITNFYKKKWIDIKELVFDSYIYSQHHGLLAQNQKLGIFNLIPQKEKDLRHLKNWRPVTLLNTY